MKKLWLKYLSLFDWADKLPWGWQMVLLLTAMAILFFVAFVL
jgi:hypothetical protein